MSLQEAAAEFSIRGVNRDTGDEISIRVQAPDEAAALSVAQRQGIMVESIAPVKASSSTSPPTHTPAHIARLIEDRKPKFEFRWKEAFWFGFYAGLGFYALTLIGFIISLIVSFMVRE